MQSFAWESKSFFTESRMCNRQDSKVAQSKGINCQAWQPKFHIQDNMVDGKKQLKVTIISSPQVHNDTCAFPYFTHTCTQIK